MAIPYASDIPMHGWRPYSDIHAERIRAHVKHDDNGGSMERKAWDQFVSWLSVIGEEWGEVNRAICEYRLNNTTKEQCKEELRKEITQTAAMLVAWLEQVNG